MNIPRFNVLGVSLCGMNLRIAVTAMLEAIHDRRKGYVCVTDVRAIGDAQEDEEFRQILNNSFLTTTDGMPLVWLGRHYVGGEVERVYGPDLLLATLAETQYRPHRHFFYGGAPGVAEELKTRMEERFPGVTICGAYSPPFRPLNPKEERELVELIHIRRPDIIWVGISTPKQERFMVEYLPRLDTVLMVGVGAAFEVYSEEKRTLRKWAATTESLLRFPKFFGQVALQRFGWRDYPIEANAAAADGTTTGRQTLQ